MSASAIVSTIHRSLALIYVAELTWKRRNSRQCIFALAWAAGTSLISETPGAKSNSGWRSGNLTNLVLSDPTLKSLIFRR